MTTITYAASLTVETCITCGVPFGVPADWQAQRRKNGERFYCPNGHTMTYGEGETAALRKRLEEAERQQRIATIRADQEKEQREASERQLAHAKARVGNGTCPCCKRHFKALKRHMACKHPDYKGAQ